MLKTASAHHCKLAEPGSYSSKRRPTPLISVLLCICEPGKSLQQLFFVEKAKISLCI